MDSKIRGIDHITFICKDVEKTAHMFKEIFSAKELYPSAPMLKAVANEKIFSLANYWIAIAEGEAIYKSHRPISVQVDQYDLPMIQDKIESLGLTVLSETEVTGDLDAVYFYDYDNHLFALHPLDFEAYLSDYLLD